MKSIHTLAICSMVFFVGCGGGKNENASDVARNGINKALDSTEKQTFDDAKKKLNELFRASTKKPIEEAATMKDVNKIISQKPAFLGIFKFGETVSIKYQYVFPNSDQKQKPDQITIYYERYVKPKDELDADPDSYDPSEWKLSNLQIHVAQNSKTDNPKAADKKADDELNKGMALLKKRDYETAISCFTEAIRLDPDLALAYNNRGFAYIIIGKYDEAIRDCSEAIRLDPKHASAYFNRGNAYGSLDKYDEAIRDYSEAIKLNPKHAPAYYNRGNKYKRKGDSDKAKADFEMAKKLGL